MHDYDVHTDANESIHILLPPCGNVSQLAIRLRRLKDMVPFARLSDQRLQLATMMAVVKEKEEKLHMKDSALEEVIIYHHTAWRESSMAWSICLACTYYS